MKPDKEGDKDFWGGVASFINDDGVTTDLNNVNEYEISIKTDTRFEDPTTWVTDSLTVTFENKRTANLDADANGCKKFNNNDYISKVMLFGYDDIQFKSRTLKADIKLRGSATTTSAVIKKDDYSKTLTVILGDSNGLCLQTIETITVK